jgi:hypothetical protein
VPDGYQTRRSFLLRAIDDERIAGKILAHFGLKSRAPPRGRLPSRGQLELLAAGADPDGIDPPLVID